MRVESLDDDELAGGAATTPARKSGGVATTPAAEMEMLRSKVEAKSSSYMANQQANAQLDPNQLKADVDKLARRMKAMNRGLIDLNGKFIQYWDFFTISALLFTLFVTPVEVALVDKVEVDALFIINQVVALIFVADMGINFRLPYKEPIKKGGATVKDPTKIAVKYLSSWFWIDLVSIVPFDIMTVAGVFGPQEAGAGSDVSKLKAVKLIRLLRLLKLARILRASRIFSRLENKLGLSFNTREMIKWSSFVFSIVHLLSCLWALAASLYGSARLWYDGTRLGRGASRTRTQAHLPPLPPQVRRLRRQPALGRPAARDEGETQPRIRPLHPRLHRGCSGRIRG